jgi:hypothetical protein
MGDPTQEDILAQKLAQANIWSDERKVLEKAYRQELKDEVRKSLCDAVSRMMALFGE